MKVSEIPYKRADIKAMSDSLTEITGRIRSAENADEILGAREDYLKLYCEYYTANALAYMRYSLNTADEFYSAEQDYYDESGPVLQQYLLEYNSALLDSPFRACLRCSLRAWRFSARACPRKLLRT